MKFKEIEKLIKKDGWILKDVSGSHYQYVHPVKKGRVTIPYHNGDISVSVLNSILKQAGIKGE
ncbi:MAG: type II toxin-antitoxin system HicA family toxin [Firmicutes bacterium]|nr:type II toxin-antitoxin system HicA family toxin [Bacillota bacterium]